MKARNANISRKILGELLKEALKVMVARQQGTGTREVIFHSEDNLECKL